jgi:preprotein translocase subunit YajC
MIRPQMKRQKELRKFQESLAKGDKVIVAGGIMGKVFDVKEDHIIVEIDDNTRIRVVKSSVLRDSSDLQQK